MDDKKSYLCDLTFNNMLKDSSFFSDIKSEKNNLVNNINSIHLIMFENDEENQINSNANQVKCIPKKYYNKKKILLVDDIGFNM